MQTCRRRLVASNWPWISSASQTELSVPVASPFLAGQVRTKKKKAEKRVMVNKNRKLKAKALHEAAHPDDSKEYPDPDMRGVTRYTLVDAMRQLQSAKSAQSPGTGGAIVQPHLTAAPSMDSSPPAAALEDPSLEQKPIPTTVNASPSPPPSTPDSDSLQPAEAAPSSTYNLTVRIRGIRDGPTLRSRFRLPHPLQSTKGPRFAVIARPGSEHAATALRLGAIQVGEGELFDRIREGKIDFDRCICHSDSAGALAKAGLGRILGPLGLMPVAKRGTIVSDVATAMEDLVADTELRENGGLVVVPVGDLGCGPEGLRDNIRLVMANVRREVAKIDEKFNRTIAEVVGSLMFWLSYGRGLDVQNR